MQRHGGQLHPVVFVTCTLTDAEKCTRIEKECLASICTCGKLSCHLCGLKSFQLMTDHKPLVALINHQDLDGVPLRYQRRLMCMMRFKAKAEHVPGKELAVADTLSKIPSQSSPRHQTQKMSRLVLIQQVLAESQNARHFSSLFLSSDLREFGLIGTHTFSFFSLHHLKASHLNLMLQ